MSQDLIIILSAIVFSLIVLAYLIKRNQTSGELMEWLKSTNRRIDDQTRSINSRLDNAARFIAEVQKNIGEMSEIGRNMKELEDFLKSPKLRGNLGEQVLKELLSEMLPKNSFHLQYGFKSGAVVDAAIKTGNGIIPIDSKFPLENFRRLIKAESEADKKAAGKDFTADVKKHIDAISKKYILVSEGTIDYALMYLPSESVFYEVVNNQDLFEYANQKRVMPVSPVTFYAYLRTVLMSFEGQKIEQKAKIIMSMLRATQKDYSILEESLQILGKHLNNAYNQMSQVSKNAAHLGQKISSTSLLPEEK